MKNTRSSKWKNNNSKERNDIVKYGFVIILIKIVGYNDPEALGTFKRLEKQTCVWRSTRPASGCGNIPDCLAGPLTAVSAAILILSSNMCRKFTASFHLVTKENSAPGSSLSLSVRRSLPLHESLKANELCWVRQKLLSSLSLARGGLYVHRDTANQHEKCGFYFNVL